MTLTQIVNFCEKEEAG